MKDFSYRMEITEQTIVCPKCEAIEEATIELTEPFNTYIHHCSVCTYVIMESEWEPATMINLGDYDRLEQRVYDGIHLLKPALAVVTSVLSLL